MRHLNTSFGGSLLVVLSLLFVTTLDRGSTIWKASICLTLSAGLTKFLMNGILRIFIRTPVPIESIFDADTGYGDGDIGAISLSE